MTIQKIENFSFQSQKTTPTHLGRSMPNDVELEASVLGAILLEKESLSDVVGILKPDVFYTTAHQKIYRAVLNLFNEEKAVDLHTLVSELKRQGSLEEVGGLPYVVQLTHRIASAANIETHARIILEYSMRRSLISISSNINNKAFDERVDTFDLLDKAEQALFGISEEITKKETYHLNNLLAEKFAEIEEVGKQKTKIVGIPSGFRELTRLTQGWQPSQLIVVGARPGMGKTSFQLDLLINAVELGKKVAFFSLEMSCGQITERLISNRAEISSEKLKTGNLTEIDWRKMYKQTAKLSESQVFLDDTAGLSLFELRTKGRRLKAKYGIEMILIDYLQLMTVGEGSRIRNFANREQEISTISRGLKALAKELDIPIIIASQLSRAVEARGGDKRPQLSDLRESGAIEQDVDIAMFLYRPEYYGINFDEDNNPTDGLAEVIIAKHRNGPRGKVLLNFKKELTRFSDFQTAPEKFIDKITTKI